MRTTHNRLSELSENMSTDAMLNPAVIDALVEQGPEHSQQTCRANYLFTEDQFCFVDPNIHESKDTGCIVNHNG